MVDLLARMDRVERKTAENGTKYCQLTWQVLDAYAPGQYTGQTVRQNFVRPSSDRTLLAVMREMGYVGHMSEYETCGAIYPDFMVGGHAMLTVRDDDIAGRIHRAVVRVTRVDNIEYVRASMRKSRQAKLAWIHDVVSRVAQNGRRYTQITWRYAPGRTIQQRVFSETALALLERAVGSLQRGTFALATIQPENCTDGKTRLAVAHVEKAPYEAIEAALRNARS